MWYVHARDIIFIYPKEELALSISVYRSDGISTFSFNGSFNFFDFSVSVSFVSLGLGDNLKCPE